ncbi:MAG: hypothetical protein ACE5G8_14065, partial [Anaerolineae bacterium]
MLKILFFGMSGAFSVAPLAGLVAAGADICGVVLPASGRQPGRSPRLLPAPPVGRDAAAQPGG